MLPSEWYLHVLCGRVSAKTWQLCAKIVSNGRGGRCTSSRRLRCTPSPCRHASFPTCSWTWWDLYQPSDRSTRWLEAVPLCNMEASTCTDAFIANWVARFGVPATVTTDRGAQFTSSLWTAASRKPCVHVEQVQRGTPTYHGC